MTGKSGRRSRWWLIFLALIIVAAASVVVFRLVSKHRDGESNRVALPPIADVDATATYLTGPGAALVDLVHATGALAKGEADAAACRSLASSSLPALGQPPALLALAAAIPDTDTADMVMNDLDAMMVALSACEAGTSTGTADLTFTRDVLSRRLAELNIT